MFPKIISKSYSIKIILLLSFFLFSYGQAPQCVLGKNCPFNQGVCANPNFCKCNEGFETLIDETLLPGQQIYCNYEQMSQWMPIILEAFLPSMGHFAAGNTWLGVGKLILVISFCLSSFALYDELKAPPLMIYLFQKLNIGKILGLEEEGKGEEEKEKEKEKEDDNKEENQLLRGRSSKERKGISKEEDVEKENDNVKENDDDENDGYKIGYQAYDEEEEETPDQEEELISKEDKKKQKEKAKRKKDKKNEKEHKYIKLIFDLTGGFGSLVYFMDIFLYKFKIYTDGNGIAFV